MRRSLPPLAPAWLPALLAVASLAAACGGSTTPGDSDAGGSGDGGGSGGSGGIGGFGGSGGADDAGLDAPDDAPADTALSCATSADCPNDGLCGFPQADACAAKGTCFPAAGPVCNAFSPGCGCDGSTLNLVCEGLPTGYALAPVAHAGVCVAETFACGQKLACTRATEYCKVGVGGVAGAEPSYACEAMPAACARDESCACVQGAVGGQRCDDSGGVTITYFYP